MTQTRDEVSEIARAALARAGWFQIDSDILADGSSEALGECVRALEVSIRSVEIAFGPDEYSPAAEFYRSRLMIRLNQIKDALLDTAAGAKSPLLTIPAGRGLNSAGASVSKRRFKILAGLLVLEFADAFGSRNAAASAVVKRVAKVGKGVSEKSVTGYANWLESAILGDIHPAEFPDGADFLLEVCRYELAEREGDAAVEWLLDSIAAVASRCPQIDSIE